MDVQHKCGRLSSLGLQQCKNNHVVDMLSFHHHIGHKIYPSEKSISCACIITNHSVHTYIQQPCKLYSESNNQICITVFTLGFLLWRGIRNVEVTTEQSTIPELSKFTLCSDTTGLSSIRLQL